tara:strand:+ start:4844 stop:6379 length:1536 start_codon:yes stop_codon:yes gene_type:complete
MKFNSIKQIFLLVVLLSITPSILFLGKNSLQAEFFSVNFFWLALAYCLSSIFITALAIRFYKKSLVFILFFAYFSFLQFYFYDMQEFLRIYKDGSTGSYVIGFIILISLIGTFLSCSSIYRNFIFILLFLNMTLAVINLAPVTGKSLQTFFNTTNTLNKTLNTKSLTSKKYPNIFYIVPDGLASPKILNEYADIDFKDSIKKFEEKGFNVPEHNYSTYNTTALSLAALFKMDYLETKNSKIYKEQDNSYPIIRDQNPKLTQYLKKNNYKFIIIPPGWGGCPKSKDYKCLRPIDNNFLYFFDDYAISSMFEHSLIKKIYNLYGARLFNDLIFNDLDDAGKTALTHLKINPEYWSDNGSFTMIHMLIPHSPYREKNCSITDRFITPSKEGYRSSVYCAFNRIHELSDFIIKKYPNASVVVQGDHGLYRKQNHNLIKFVEISNSLIDHRLGAFTAVRGCNSNQAAKLNQVNIIKYIIECLVSSTPTKQYENKSYFGFYESPADLGKVMRVLKIK